MYTESWKLRLQDLRYFVPLPPNAVEKGKESSVPGKLELLKVRCGCDSRAACGRFHIEDKAGYQSNSHILHLIPNLKQSWLDYVRQKLGRCPVLHLSTMLPDLGGDCCGPSWPHITGSTAFAQGCC